MEDRVAEFFDSLESRPADPLLPQQASGTLRFDIDGDGTTRTWLVSFAHGVVVVSREPGDANAGIRATDALFTRIVRGEANPLTAVMRGEIQVEGDPELLLRFQRLLPSPGARTPVGSAS